jgi:hypothetical protein
LDDPVVNAFQDDLALTTLNSATPTAPARPSVAPMLDQEPLTVVNGLDAVTLAATRPGS